MTINKRTGWLVVALVFVLTTFGFTPARGNNSASKPQDQVQKVGNGEEVKIIGVVLKRGGDSFTYRDGSGVVRDVALTSATVVKTHKKGAFRGGKTYASSYILRGLRVEVVGTGNAEGQIVAKEVRFDESDLRTAQALQASVDPVEELAKANEELAKANRARIIASEENQKRMSGQIAENEEAARRAQKTADEANNRINGLGDYDPVKTITVLFATGSPVLGPKGKAEIDAAAKWVKTQDTKGWVVAVVGFADTSGNTAANRRLSERRANSVIGYLVAKHHLPLTRLVQPFGYGEGEPIADNKTAEGRAKNRRVEIRLLVNKGIANKTE